MAAAPADFTVENMSPRKIKKEKANLKLELSPAIDILKKLRDRKTDKQRVIGFALETDDAMESARRKLKEKGLDLIVLNSLEDGIPFESDLNRTTLIYPDGKTEPLPVMDKMKLARLLIDKAIKL
jgi:phosphopantothenoylcysteine decarboxylase/phosphopantothenate--cysteine ligase